MINYYFQTISPSSNFYWNMKSEIKTDSAYQGVESVDFK
jgi:hypothetical protein